VAQNRREEQALVYANAGHAPVIFRPAGGRARLLEADGVPIGVLPVSLSEDQHVPFGPGDLLIVATDGFNESFDPAGAMFGYERLLDLVDQVAGRTAQAIGDALYEAVTSFAAGRPRDDDQTIIVLKGVAL
jgi:sigma-B regulation protein RsbU (phosphoserine phosphatase)